MLGSALPSAVGGTGRNFPGSQFGCLQVCGTEEALELMLCSAVPVSIK